MTMESDEIYIGDKVDEVFRRNDYDASPVEIDHDVELRGNYLYVEFHEPPKWKQRGEEDE
jgi:hypothetical protein